MNGMLHPGAWRAGLAVAGLALLCLALYGPPAARTPFFTKGEPREALVVRDIVDRGGWVLPHRPSALGRTIASKPPFFHWVAALVSRAAGGVTELTVRAPSVVFASAAVVATCVAAAPLLGLGAAFTGAVVLATTFEWMNAAQSARVDATLAALMTIALLIFHRGFVGDGLSRRAALAAYACLAAAALTKGPVGFLLPALIVGAALVVGGRLRLLGRLHPLLGAAVIVTVVGGWYLAGWIVGGDPFFERHVLKENVFRFLGASRLASGHAHALTYYLYIFPLGFLPWTPLLAGALAAALRSRAARRDPAVLFLLVWVGVTFGFYSAASAKRGVYLIALYPGAALLCGWWLAGLGAEGEPGRWVRTRPARIAALALMAVTALPLLLILAEWLGVGALDLLGPLMSRRDRENLPLVQGVIRAYAPLVALVAAAIPAALALGFRALGQGRWRAAFAAGTALASALWILVFGIFRPAVAERRSLEPFMASTARATAGAPLYFHPPTFDFSAAFYAPGEVSFLPPEGADGAYVLIWDTDAAELGSAERAALEILATSAGTDPKGRRHMHLARLRADPDRGSGG